MTSGRQAVLVAALLGAGVTGSAPAQPAGKIDIKRMRPTGLLVDDYSYMSPPHNAYYFHHIDQLGFRISRVKRSGPSHPLLRSTEPVTIRYPAGSGELTLDDYFTRNQVTGFLILRGDTILLERYFHGATQKSRFVSQSVGKSILSILVGVAVEQGKLASVDDPVTKYLPELAGSGYRNATIKNVLQMATGVDYSENYRDSTSGAALIGAALITGKPSFTEFVASMKPTAAPPGTTFQYQSVNSQLLGWLLERVTEMPLSLWAETSLWSKLGAESDGFFYQAKGQTSTCAFACFNATLRDYGRVGLLMLGQGGLGGRRVVSEAWVRQSTTPDAPYLEPSTPGSPGRPRTGYGYQWWIPPGSEGEYLAIGIYGQAIYINPTRRIVVVQTAAWPTPIGDQGLSTERSAVFAAIARQLGSR
jgi:CubicO group peptidase (beta-lactamase class C family)